MKLSIVIPTYNNEKTLAACLESLYLQKFDKKQYEVMIIDGGSSDKTVEIAKKYKSRIINNPKRVEENARIIGMNKAKGEVIALIDADNVVIGKDWIKKMLLPFNDKKIAFADTLYFSSRKSDHPKVRYQALIGGDDPFVNNLGFYSRWCFYKNDWTDYPYKSTDQGEYLKISLSNKKLVPAMGSNGFLIRKTILKKFVKNSFIHSDIIYELVNNNYNCFAKVKTGIVHDQPTFFKNKVRRMQRRNKNQVKITYNYGVTKFGLAKSAVRTAFILPLFWDMVKGYKNKPDSAWLFHIPASIGLLFIYVYYSFLSLIKFK